MSVEIFELKNEHLLLLKHLRWSVDKNKFLVSAEDIDVDTLPFSSDNFYNAVNLILSGKPEKFDPLNTDEFEIYTQEQKEEMDKLYNDLPLALEIILSMRTFEVGTYKCRWHLRDWKKIG
jgi:hypothetical protein